MLSKLRLKTGPRKFIALAILATLVVPEDGLAQQRPRSARRRPADMSTSAEESTNAPAANAKPKEKKLKLVAKVRELADHPVPSRIRPISVSADGERVAYELLRGDRHVVVVDGREVGVFARIWNFKFSPDSAHVAFVGQRFDSDRQAVVLDGREVGVFAEVAPESLAFSHAGDRFGFVARVDGEQPTWVAILDGKPSKTWEEILPRSLVFSSDGAQVAYAARSGGRWQVVTNGEAGLAWDEIAPRSLSFSRAGGRFGYAARSDTNWRAVIDGKGGALAGAIADAMPVFSRDGKHVAVGLQRDDRWHIVVDEVEQKAADRVEQFVFSSDGTRHAYVARRGGKDVLVLDGKDDKEFPEITGPLVFSPDGKRFAFVAQKDGRPLVLVDGKESKAYDEIRAGPIFGSDNQHVAWLARSGDKWLAVMDSTESTDTYDGCKGGLVFNEPNRIAFYAIKLDAARNDEFLAVEMTLAEE